MATRDSKRNSAVDYVVGTLVNDSEYELHRIVRVFTPVQRQNELQQMH